MFRRIAVGISGGVDSAVSAHLLKIKGFDVQGVFLKTWDETEETGDCTTKEDWNDAQEICQKLNIPIRQVDFVKEYWTDVFENFLSEYQCGRTPNPDVNCNKFIKFGVFFRYARDVMHADAIATGHYARSSFGAYLEHFDSTKNVKLLRAADTLKDQTLFLSQVKQEALQRTMFPVGEMQKQTVKQIALKIGLEKTFRKRESRGICFIGKRKFHDFISNYVPDRPGNFIDVETGRILGRHQGLHNFTIGQRVPVEELLRMFAVRKVIDENVILVAAEGHRFLFSDLFHASNVHWIDRSPFQHQKTFDCEFRFQHTHELKKCSLVQTRIGLLVFVSKPIRSLRTGQFATFYDDDECIGSAKIVDVISSI